MKQFYSLILIFTFFAGFSQEKQIGEVLYEVNMMMPEALEAYNECENFYEEELINFKRKNKCIS